MVTRPGFGLFFLKTIQPEFNKTKISDFHKGLQFLLTCAFNGGNYFVVEHQQWATIFSVKFLNISGRHHRFPPKMTSEEQLQKFHLMTCHYAVQVVERGNLLQPIRNTIQICVVTRPQ